MRSPPTGLQRDYETSMREHQCKSYLPAIYSVIHNLNPTLKRRLRKVKTETVCRAHAERRTNAITPQTRVTTRPKPGHIPRGLATWDFRHLINISVISLNAYECPSFGLFWSEANQFCLRVFDNKNKMVASPRSITITRCGRMPIALACHYAWSKHSELISMRNCA